MSPPKPCPPQKVPLNPSTLPLGLTQLIEKIWASLITNTNYLPGLLTLHASLLSTHTAYPFVALYTPSLPATALAALHARNIRTHPVPPLAPEQTRGYAHDPRFTETWTKLVVFSLEEYDRVVLLDGDMLVRRNMDELMSIPLSSSADGEGEGVFAASHACACNPLQKPHYPPTWYVPDPRYLLRSRRARS